MKLTTKFNFVLIFVFALSFVGASYLVYKILQDNARHDIVERAGMMLEAALAIRGYTVSEIRPLLKEKMQHEFLPQSVPAYAATQSFDKIRKNHPEYAYKEATLNPTNLRNRATDWETDIIQGFSNNPDTTELIGQRNTPTGPSLYLARPIKIKNKGCLSCHSIPNNAPTTLIAKYGNVNGFGWNMNEIVGAQIVSVPMSVPIQKANETFVKFMGFLLIIYICIIIILNFMLRHIIIKPIMEMSVQANNISMGKFDTPEFSEQGKDEVSILAASFNRMRRSLQKTMKMLQDRGPKMH